MTILNFRCKLRTIFFFIMLLSILTFHTYVVVTSVLKKYNSDPLSVIYRWKGLVLEVVLKQCSGFWGHSLEGSKGGCLGFLKNFFRISCPKCLKFRIWTLLKVPEINLKFFLRLGTLRKVSRISSVVRMSRIVSRTWHQN